MSKIKQCHFTQSVLVPFYRGAVVFMQVNLQLPNLNVLVPFYRGAVVFNYQQTILMIWLLSQFSSPFIEERLYLGTRAKGFVLTLEFSSPFIEERLYLDMKNMMVQQIQLVLVPFYRGAVVFNCKKNINANLIICSRPLLSRSGCIYNTKKLEIALDLVLVPFYRGAVVFLRLII